MDELDSEIVRLLQTDARQSNREIARTLGIAPSTCLERIRTLTRRGVIQGYHAAIDMRALNRDTQALVDVRLRHHKRSAYQAFKKEVHSWPETIEQFVVSGREDVVIHVGVQNTERLHAFLVDHLGSRPEVERFQTLVVFEHTHKNVLSALPPG